MKLFGATQPDASKERDRVHREFVAAQDRLAALSAELDAARLEVGRAQAAEALGEKVEALSADTVQRLEADMRRQEALIQGLRERLIQADETERRARPGVAEAALNGLTKQTGGFEKAVREAAAVLEGAQATLSAHRSAVETAETALEAARKAAQPLPRLQILRGDPDALEAAVNAVGCTIDRPAALKHIREWRGGITKGGGGGFVSTYPIGEAVLCFDRINGQILKATPTQAMEKIMDAWVNAYPASGLEHPYCYSDEAIIAECQGKLAEAV